MTHYCSEQPYDAKDYTNYYDPICAWCGVDKDKEYKVHNSRVQEALNKAIKTLRIVASPESKYDQFSEMVLAQETLQEIEYLEED